MLKLESRIDILGPNSFALIQFGIKKRMIYQIIIISCIPGIKHIQEKTSHTISYGVYEKILVIQFHRRKLYDKHFLNRLFSKKYLKLV